MEFCNVCFEHLTTRHRSSHMTKKRCTFGRCPCGRFATIKHLLTCPYIDPAYQKTIYILDVIVHHTGGISSTHYIYAAKGYVKAKATHPKPPDPKILKKAKNSPKSQAEIARLINDETSRLLGKGKSGNKKQKCIYENATILPSSLAYELKQFFNSLDEDYDLELVSLPLSIKKPLIVALKQFEKTIKSTAKNRKKKYLILDDSDEKESELISDTQTNIDNVENIQNENNESNVNNNSNRSPSSPVPQIQQQRSTSPQPNREKNDTLKRAHSQEDDFNELNNNSNNSNNLNQISDDLTDYSEPPPPKRRRLISTRSTSSNSNWSDINVNGISSVGISTRISSSNNINIGIDINGIVPTNIVIVNQFNCNPQFNQIAPVFNPCQMQHSSRNNDNNLPIVEIGNHETRMVEMEMRMPALEEDNNKNEMNNMNNNINQDNNNRVCIDLTV